MLNEWGFGAHLSTGKGIVALFSGEPGTGKTFCAELLATELDLTLQVVSIPDVMSKWVAETERNTAELFSHARAQNSLLMFDEADALFTTRVKVERSMDRFSNMEVNQLLGEVDRFEGIVILTTNLETSLDRAFKRRGGAISSSRCRTRRSARPSGPSSCLACAREQPIDAAILREVAEEECRAAGKLLRA